MGATYTPKNMSRDDFRAGERRWQRKRLFREQRPRTLPRLIAILLILGAFAALAWWLEVPIFDFSLENMLP